MSVRVIVVEDHPVTRVGIVALLGQDDRITVVGEAADGEGGLEVAAREDPDVVVTDLRLGDGLDGVGLTRALRSGRGAPEVLVLTTYDTDRDIVRAVEAGASGYLLKDAAPADIVEAVVRAAGGETVLAPALAQRVVARMSRPRPELSAREVEIVAAVARGLGNREIARTLVISEATVKTHLVHVFTKLDVDSRTAAVARAREEGLIP
ncbi:response regulator [Janibacter hoylei]|uniref:response regulator n=1 Tax=Janibacter hoylei TaxID=364298 RepID=UPI0021A34755|nr:response regulator transcription factor [Janibacter hoylei]MCT1618894.1 response regulator transcription factor [Janibacter hoylei]MCT2292345.1 response regulator transcription factor [Janibacter hoylei]MCW4600772.1 response regulator transcription factor [Janibacter hoylei]